MLNSKTEKAGYFFNKKQTAMTHTIKIKTVLPYPQEIVWLALTNSKLLGSWFMENNIEPIQGHYFTFRMKPQKGWDDVTHCEITAVEPQKHIAYTYSGEATGEKVLACAGIHADTANKMAKGIFTKLDTKLSFILESTCGGTLDLNLL